MAKKHWRKKEEGNSIREQGRVGGSDFGIASEEDTLGVNVGNLEEPKKKPLVYAPRERTKEKNTPSRAPWRDQ